MFQTPHLPNENNVFNQELYKSLHKVNEHEQRWTYYKNDQNQCLNNLENFQKKCELEILVPIGSKGFMPGTLYHTSETLVSHFQNYYSANKSSQAIKICTNRMKTAEQILDKFKIEENLVRNKIEMSQNVTNAFNQSSEQEIIEEYDELNENLWRQKHKESIKKQKVQEKIERQNLISNDLNIFDKLDELEILEELNNELADLQIELPQINDIDILLSSRNRNDSKENKSIVEPIIITFSHSLQKKPDKVFSTGHLANPATFYEMNFL